MQIKAYDVSARNNALDGAYPTHEAASHGSDVGFFTSMLEQPTKANTAAAVSPMLADTTKYLSASKERLTKVLRATGKDVDLEAFKTFPRELSNAQLTSQLLIKSLGKTTQCIEKISNLQ